MARIAGIDLPKEKRVEIGLTYIYGIGRKTSNDILAAAGVNPDTRVKDLTEEEVAEQKALRAEYIADFRASFTGILENTVIQYPDGSRQSLPDMRDAKKNEKK